MQTQLQTQPQQQPTFAPTYTSAPTAASTSSAEPAASTLEMNRAMKRNALTPRPYGKAAEARPPKVPLAPAKKMQAKFNPLVDFPIYLVIFLGGMIGTALRYGLALLIPNPVAESGFLNAFHTATFIANMCASFILAFTSTYLAQAVWIRKRSRTLVSNAIGIGMCGGFSTMSTFAVENMKTLDKANYAGFFFYTIVTFVCGIVLCWLASHWAMHIASKRSAHKAEDSLHQSAQPLPAVGGVRVPSTPLNNVDADDDDADYGNYTDAREREYDHERKLTREHVTSSQFAATRAGSQTQSSSMQPSAATISYDAVPSASAVHYGAVPAAAAAAAVPTAATTDSGEAPIIDATPERLSEVTREATEHRLQLERQHQQAQAHMQPPAFEPDPITDELELVADANTGEVH